MSIHPWNLPLWRELSHDRARLPHAVLLHGPRGVGKRDFALALAQWLLCEAPGEDGACGHCRACGWFEQGAHPDFRLLQPESENAEAGGKRSGQQIAIGAIRDLADFLGLVSHQGGWRVVLVQPAEAMNPAAANALLKTLEEPPAGVLLILVAHQPRRLLPTLLSRCRKLPFKLPPRDQALAWLEANGLQDAAASLDEVGGAPLLAAEYAEPERMERRRHFLAALAARKMSSAVVAMVAREFIAAVRPADAAQDSVMH